MRQLGVVIHTCHAGTQEAEAGGWQAWEASRVYTVKTLFKIKETWAGTVTQIARVVA